MLPDLRFRIIAQNASKPAFDEVRRDTKATEAAFGALNGSLAQANRNWMMLGSGAANATKLSTQQLAFMQFQLQDIAVMLASGQSPFVLMMQQGSQIVQMFGPGTGVLGALKAVGSGILTFVTNPLNLALLGFASASAAVGALWSAVSDGGGKAEDTLERHADLVRRINEAYGEATIGVEEFARESAAVVQFQFEQHVAGLRQQLQTAVQGFLGDVMFTDEFGQSQVLAGFESFSGAIDSLADSAEAGEPDVRAFRETLVALARARPELAGIVSEMLSASDAIDTLSRAAEAANRVGTPDASYNGYVAAAFQVFAEAEAYDKLKSQLEGMNRVRKQAKTDAEKLAEAVARVVENLEFEREQLFRTAQEQELYNALKTAGVERESEYGRQIEASVRALQIATAEHERMVEAQQAIAEAQQFFGDAIYDSLTSLILYGRDAEDVMKRLALAIGEAAAQAILFGEGPLGNLLWGGNGAGGGLIGSLFSGLFGGGSLPNVVVGGLYHSGGVVGSSGVPGMAVPAALFAGAPRLHSGGMIPSLRADEVPAILQRGETVLPKGARAGGSQMNVSINVNVSGARGNAEIEQMVAAGVGKGLDKFRREVLPRDVKVHASIGLRQGDIRR